MTNKQNRPIGLFDSGVGGLSVLKQFVRFLPNENYIYLGDTARVPYGNKSVEIVKQYSKEATLFMLEKDVKLIVIACNTASALALDTVKEVAGDIPVIGMINPAAGAALRATLNHRIGIIGTRATIQSNAYQNEIHRLSAAPNELNVFAKACPLFVPLVEEGLLAHNATFQIAEEYLTDFKTSGIDTLVLGCTHYPLLSHLISDILPNVNLIDSGEHSAVLAIRLLAGIDMLVKDSDIFIDKPKIDFYVTDVPSSFFEVAQRFLGFSVDSPHKIQLD